MLKEAVDTYLAVRRAAGFILRDEELYLRGFVRFATARGEAHVVAQTAIAWAEHAPSESQRAARLKEISGKEDTQISPIQVECGWITHWSLEERWYLDKTHPRAYLNR
jgi:hypothetical protein